MSNGKKRDRAKQMQEYAEVAVLVAKEMKWKLDYSMKSIDVMEKAAVYIYQIDLEVDHEVAAFNVATAFGAYLGETLLRNGLAEKGFTWRESEDGDVGIGTENAWLGPITKVYKRITRGRDHDIRTFCDIAFEIANGTVGTVPFVPKPLSVGKPCLSPEGEARPKGRLRFDLVDCGWGLAPFASFVGSSIQQTNDLSPSANRPLA